MGEKPAFNPDDYIDSPTYAGMTGKLTGEQVRQIADARIKKRAAIQQAERGDAEKDRVVATTSLQQIPGDQRPLEELVLEPDSRIRSGVKTLTPDRLVLPKRIELESFARVERADISPAVGELAPVPSGREMQKRLYPEWATLIDETDAIAREATELVGKCGLTPESLKKLASFGYRVEQGKGLKADEIMIVGDTRSSGILVNYIISKGNPIKDILLNLQNSGSSYELVFTNADGKKTPNLILADRKPPREAPTTAAGMIDELSTLTSSLSPGSERAYRILSARFSDPKFGEEIKSAFFTDPRFQQVRDGMIQYILSEGKRETGALWFKSIAIPELATKGKDDIVFTDFIKTKLIPNGLEFSIDGRPYILGYSSRERKTQILPVSSANNPVSPVNFSA